MEQDRLGEAKSTALNTYILKRQADLQHRLWLLTLGDERLFLAPILEQLITRGGKVLDMGTGTGIWAIEFGVKPYSLVWRS